MWLDTRTASNTDSRRECQSGTHSTSRNQSRTRIAAPTWSTSNDGASTAVGTAITSDGVYQTITYAASVPLSTEMGVFRDLEHRGAIDVKPKRRDLDAWVLDAEAGKGFAAVAIRQLGGRGAVDVEDVEDVVRGRGSVLELGGGVRTCILRCTGRTTEHSCRGRQSLRRERFHDDRTQRRGVDEPATLRTPQREPRTSLPRKSFQK